MKNNYHEWLDHGKSMVCRWCGIKKVNIYRRHKLGVVYKECVSRPPNVVNLIHARSKLIKLAQRLKRK